MLVKTRLVGDLISPKTNPAASRADIRAPRASSPKPVSPPPTMGTMAASSEFESMLAMSDAQNQIIGEVLEGPVSQQTQRQLARLKESNSRGQLARELSQGKTPALAEALLKNHSIDDSMALAASSQEAAAAGDGRQRVLASEGADPKSLPGRNLLEAEARLAASAGLNSPKALGSGGQAEPTASATEAADAQAVFSQEAAASESAARVNRRPTHLSAGLTIAAGVDTGRVFNSAQLTAFKQKNGLGLAPGRMSASLAAGAQGADSQSIKPQAAKPQGALDWNVAEGAKRLTRGATPQRESAEALANPAPSDPKEIVKSSEKPEKPQSLSGSDIDTIVNKVGQALGLDPSLIKAVIKTESNFNNKAVSPAGAQGLMQLMPGTAREMGVKDPFSPLDNIWGGARYLKRMLDSHGGNLNRALAAYNWGPGNLQKYGNKRMPRETRRYIEVVNRNYASFKKQMGKA